MRKAFILSSILLQFLFVNCVQSKIIIQCDENLEFKKVYFEKIKIIDDKMKKEILVSEDDFKSALLFISKYSKVDFDSMANYAHTYPLGVYQSDREEWIKWYEENKCKNIQFKS